MQRSSPLRCSASVHFLSLLCLQECHEKGEFILCWDPLDGSSIVDCNWAVGTIISVWRLGVHGLEWKGADTLISKTGEELEAGI